MNYYHPDQYELCIITIQPIQLEPLGKSAERLVNQLTSHA